MATAAVQMTIAVPLEEVWAFVSRFENWAELMPGYQAAERVSEDVSVWTLRTDVGIFQRVVQLRAAVTGKEPPAALQFTLEGLDEPVTGEGVFRAEACGHAETRVELTLSMRMGGMLAPVVGALFEKVLPADVQRLAGAIKRKLETAGSVHN